MPSVGFGGTALVISGPHAFQGFIEALDDQSAGTRQGWGSRPVSQLVLDQAAHFGRGNPLDRPRSGPHGHDVIRLRQYSKHGIADPLPNLVARTRVILPVPATSKGSGATDCRIAYMRGSGLSISASIGGQTSA